MPDPTRGFMREVARGIAYRAVRNRGTLGGSLRMPIPRPTGSARWRCSRPTCIIAGPGWRRESTPSDFVTGPFSTALGADEILVGVRIPKLSERGALGLLQVQPQAGRIRRGDRPPCLSIREPASTAR